MFLDGAKQTGNIEEAKIIYDALLEDAPDNGLYRIERAKILLALGQSSGAGRPQNSTPQRHTLCGLEGIGTKIEIKER